MKKILYIPKRVHSNFKGFETLMSLFSPLLECEEDAYFISFENCDWFDANLMPVIYGFVSNAKKKFEVVIGLYERYKNPKISEIMMRNGFSNHCFNKSYKPHKNETVIQFKQFESSRAEDFGEYFDKEINKRFPEMSEYSKKTLNVCISELFVNAKTHGKTKYVITCGQFYPTEGRLEFTMVDVGDTFSDNVTEYFERTNQSFSGNCIEWATEPSHTTKQETGGLGLTMLNDLFVRYRGKLQIISGNEFYEIRDKNKTVKTLKNTFPGAIINVELFQSNDYKVKSIQSISKNNYDDLDILFEE